MTSGRLVRLEDALGDRGGLCVAGALGEGSHQAIGRDFKGLKANAAPASRAGVSGATCRTVNAATASPASPCA